MLSDVQSSVDAILDRQRVAWMNSRRISIEDLLAQTPFQNDPEVQLDLVYNEVVIREELGEAPELDDYVGRYPHLAEDLKLHFEIHRAVNDPLLAEGPEALVDTDDNAAAPSWPESRIRPREVLPRINGYDLDRQIGHGGMAVVYQARQQHLNRDVAIKMFHPNWLPASREIVRFRTEAQAIARLKHPNIIQIFEIGTHDGLPYLVLELAEQGTLGQRLQNFAYTPRAAAELIEVLAHAVQHSHDQQVIHRDLKPANVLFTDAGTPKITDFGLAKLLLEDAEVSRDATRTGESLGTPRYMAPEQAVGDLERIGPLTDVYALGTLLYECLTGQPPFVATSVAETLQKIQLEEPISPRRLQPSIPRDLATICLHCLHKEPHRRYPSAGLLASDLRHFLAGEPIRARPTPLWERTAKWCRRRPAHAALIALFSLLLIGSLSAGFVMSHLEQQRLQTLREEVANLMRDGQAALARNEVDEAYARFRAAWMKVQSEPELADHQPGVAGWLDHGRNAVNQQQWKQRLPPREYDQRRDDALVQSLLLETNPKSSVQDARDALHEAFDFTLPDDHAWILEREFLTLLESDVVAYAAGPAQALQLLDGTKEFSSWLFHERRADYLTQLGRVSDAKLARAVAARFPPDKLAAQLLNGVDRLRRRKFDAALLDFQIILNNKPEHFLARLCESICFLHLKRPAEALVALTACVAQRPSCAWSYFLRSQANQALADSTLAEQDLQRTLAGNPPEPLRQAAANRLEVIQRGLKTRPGDGS